MGELDGLSAEQVIERCRTYLVEARKDVLELHANRTLWRDVTDAMQRTARPDESGFWMAHYSRVYVAAQIMALRRTIRGNAEQVSLARMLGWLEQRPDAVTTRYVSSIAETAGVDKGIKDYVVGQFIEDWSDGHDHLDPAIPKRDRATLFTGAPAAILAWADRMVAHRYPPEVSAPKAPLFKEIDDAIDVVRVIYQRYWALLTGIYDAMEHLGMPLGWKLAFRRPLFPDGD